MLILPIYIRRPATPLPLVTFALLLGNIVLFLISPVRGSLLGEDTSGDVYCQISHFFSQWGAIPEELLTGRVVSTVPSLPPLGPESCSDLPPDYWKIPFLSVATAMFAHGSWLHLLVNMIYLVVFGDKVEAMLGRARFLALYVSAGYIATYAEALAEGRYETQPLLGASGAAAAVLGAYIVMCPKNRVFGLCPPLLFLPVIVPAWFVLGGWLFTQWFYATGLGLAGLSSAGYVAHIYGFGYVGALYAAATGRNCWFENREPAQPVRRGDLPSIGVPADLVVRAPRAASGTTSDDDLVWPPPPGHLRWPVILGVIGFITGPFLGITTLIWSLCIRQDYVRHHWATRQVTVVVIMCTASALAGAAQGRAINDWLLSIIY